MIEEDKNIIISAPQQKKKQKKKDLSRRTENKETTDRDITVKIITRTRGFKWIILVRSWRHISVSSRSQCRWVKRQVASDGCPVSDDPVVP